MNDKITLNFGNPLEKNLIPKDTLSMKNNLLSNKSLQFSKNKTLDKNFSFKNNFSFNKKVSGNNSFLNKKLNTNFKNVSIEPKLDYKKIGGEGFKRIKQQHGLSMWGDADGDGVKNILDCWPLDPKRQGGLHTIQSIYANPNLTEEEKQSAILSLQAQEEAMKANQTQPQAQPIEPVEQENKQQSRLQKLGSLLSSSAGAIYGATGIPDKLEEQREQKEFQRQAKLAALQSIRADISKGKDSEFAKEIARAEVKKLFPQQRQPIGNRVGNSLNAVGYGAQTSLRGISQGIGMVGLGRSISETRGFGSYQGENFKGLGNINPRGPTQQQMQPQQMQSNQPQQYSQPQQMQSNQPQQYSQPQGRDLKSQISNAKKPFFGPVAPDGRKWSERSKKYVTYERGNYQDYTRPTYNTQYGGGY